MNVTALLTVELLAIGALMVFAGLKKRHLELRPRRVRKRRGRP